MFHAPKLVFGVAVPDACSRSQLGHSNLKRVGLGFGSGFTGTAPWLSSKRCPTKTTAPLKEYRRKPPVQPLLL